MEALPRPAPGDLPAYYVRYLDRAEGATLAEALQEASRNMHATIALLAARGDHAYAPGKWSVKEVLLHVVDAERIFAYRALRFARNDATPLPGFEENDYAPSHARAAARWPPSSRSTMPCGPRRSRCSRGSGGATPST